jgi:hypothetical protein
VRFCKDLENRSPTCNVIEPEALPEIMELLCRLHTCLLLAGMKSISNLSRTITRTVAK